ncbi:MAG: hypothetical protein ABI140_19480 [Jatrophihabitantaceae bacterium]
MRTEQVRQRSTRTPRTLSVNLDCGLRTRIESEAIVTLRNMVAAAQALGTRLPSFRRRIEHRRPR